MAHCRYNAADRFPTGVIPAVTTEWALMIDTTIREATEFDCAPIIGIINDYRAETGHAPVDEDAVARSIRACISEDSTHEILVLETQGVVAGYVAVHWIPFPMLQGVEGYISDLIIARANRELGFGQQLVASVEQRGRERGCVRLMLNNRIAAESFQREFYPKLGFVHREDFANLVKMLR